MYIKKLDLLYYLVNNFSTWQFEDTHFLLDTKENNMLVTKVISQDNNVIFATLKVFFNYDIQLFDTEINYL